MSNQDADLDPPARLDRPDGETIAYRARAGAGPGLMFLCGFMSDMGGTKALALDEYANRSGRASLRFDYFGHGHSSGAFTDGTIGRWLNDAVAVLDQVAKGPQILIGSSMGGWLATLVALARPERVAGLILIAPALDFTAKLMAPTLPPEATAALAEHGVWRAPSLYDPAGYPITRRLLDEGNDHLLLDRAIPLACPVRILQGMEDPDVPWRHAVRTIEAIVSPDSQLTLIKDGDHRLSRRQDIALLESTVGALAAAVAKPYSP